MSNSLDGSALALIEQSFDYPSSDRLAWIAAAGAPAEVRERALALLSQRDVPDRLRTGGIDDALPSTPLPSRIGAYRVTGLIGQGGMGAVYRGQRAAGDFEHEVAIKVVRPGALSEALVERFATERQTLARLAHPNIARLFDGGATDEGAPYIVMELIDGVPLDDWLAGEPDKAARLQLFLGICSAVGFAHQNLIIHRDITPANILVERDGTPKLIDFGIARPATEAEPAGPLAPEGMSWTPGFAAPERLTGGTATTLGDIYGLGRLLDRLFPANHDRDLAAIITMATAVDPATRYPTADALAEDVKAWRDGFPVTARRGGAVYGARRFAARHPFAVSAAFLVSILLIAAAAAILQANARAERQRAQAIARFEQTRSIAKTMMFDVFDLVSRLPSSTRAREALARSGLRYLDALAADRDAPFDVRVEAGRGYARLASVIGSGEGSTLGALADGTKLLDKAAAILARARRERPSDPGARRAYAAVLVERAIVTIYNDNDPGRARADAEQARRLVAADARTDAESARVYALSLQTQADSWGWDDDWARARPLLLANERFIAALPSPIRNTRPMLFARASNFRVLGEVHHKLKEEEAARVALDRAVAINEALLADDPSDPLARRRVATTNWYRAVVHRTARRDVLAANSIARASTAAKVLRDADPADAGSAHLWAIVAEVESQILMDVGRREQAFDVSGQVTAEYRRLIVLSGDAPGMRRSFSAALRTIGGNYYNGGDFTKACVAWRESHALLMWLEAHGALTEMDRKNGLANVSRYIATSCDNGPPRAGLGSKID